MSEYEGSVSDLLKVTNRKVRNSDSYGESTTIYLQTIMVLLGRICINMENAEEK